MLFKSNLFWGHVRLNLTVKSNGPARMIRLVLWSLFIDSIIFMNNHSNLGVEGNHNGCDDNSSDNDDGSIGHRVVCISQTPLKSTHFPSLPPQSLPSAMYMGILIPQHPPLFLNLILNTSSRYLSEMQSWSHSPKDPMRGNESFQEVSYRRGKNPVGLGERGQRLFWKTAQSWSGRITLALRGPGLDLTEGKEGVINEQQA